MPKSPFTGVARNRINVTCAADAGYGPYAGITLCSVLTANHDSEVYIYLFSDGILQKDLDRIEGVAVNYGAKLFVYEMRAELNAHPALRDHFHYSRAAYLRLFIPWFVPPDVDWIIYSDSDVICVTSWRDMWEQRGDIPVVGAVVDPWITRDRHHKQSLGISAEQNYYGSGVLLINVDAWRRRKLSEELLEFVQSREPTRYPDQDAINCVLGKEITELPGPWNTLVTSPDHIDMSRDMEQAVNIHYCSSLKPWHLGYRFLRGTGAREFAQAKALSPWRRMLPDFQTQRIKRKLQRVLG